MNHEKVVQEWYEISFETSHRFLPGKIDEFLEGSLEEGWTTLRDFEGDFEGILIYSGEQSPIEFICKKIGIDYEDVKGLDFKLVT